MNIRQMLADVGPGQHGLVERSQALAHGVTPDLIHGGLKQGSIERLFARVYRAPGSPRTWRQELLGACLSAGRDAVASHRAAVGLHGLAGVRPGALEITIGRRKAPNLAGVTIHCSGDLLPDDVVDVDGVPTTTPDRTLVDLGASSPRWVVDEVMLAALARRLVTIESLWRMLGRVSRQGRSGAGVLRALLERRSSVPDSVLEGLFLQLVERFGLPAPVLQYPVTSSDRRYRIDAAYPDRLLAIELDGAGTHASPDALQSDLVRQNALVEAGFTVLRFTFTDLTGRRGAVVRQVREMHGRLPILASKNGVSAGAITRER